MNQLFKIAAAEFRAAGGRHQTSNHQSRTLGLRHLHFLAILVLATCAGALASRSANFSGSDDFSGISGSWRADGCGGNGSFAVGNGTLNFTTGGQTSSNDTCGRNWIANYGSYTAHWSVRMDITVGCITPGPNGYASVSLTVGKLNSPTSNFMRVSLTTDGTSSRYYYADTYARSIFLGAVFVPTSSKTVTIGLSYNSATHTMTAGYDSDGPANGYLFTPFSSTNIASGAANWAMTATDVFEASIYAQSANTSISDGQISVDNFVASPSQLPWVATNNVPPSISVQPQSQAVTVGNSATFSVAASGAQPVTYQWRFNGANIPSASGPAYSVYTMCNVQTNQAGNYRVFVTNPLGVATSAVVVLTVNVPPSITKQPASKVVTKGGSVAFSVTASGTRPLSYQWYSNNVAIAGATPTNYTINPVQLDDAGDYMVRVSNIAGTVDSAVATLTVQYPPVIITQPQGQAVTIGSNATFSVVAAGNPSPSYRWRFNGINIAGATASIYTRNNVQPADAGNYTVVVSNSLGSVTSQSAGLIANHPPTVSFAVSTNGTGFFSPATITFTASAADSDGSILHVGFYQSSTLVGTATNSQYVFTWSNVGVGSYILSAQATDNLGATTISTPISITVKPTECVPPLDALAAWWPGDGNANEIVGNKNWTVFGGTTFAPGKVGQSFSFNGTDAYVARANDVATTAVDNWALAAWVYWKGFVGTTGKQKQVLLYNGNGGANGYGILIPEPGACPGALCSEVGQLVADFGGISNIPLGVALDQNTWNHIALVRENGVLKLYKNGALVFSNAIVAPNPPAPSNGFIYVGGGAPNNFNGLLDEIMFFNTSLTADQVRAIFSADSLGLCKPLIFDGIRASANNSVTLNVVGQEGKNVTVYSSSNLASWTPLFTRSNPNGSFQFTNAMTGGAAPEFYRASAAATNLVMISPGTFVMGSPPDELDRLDNEGPQTVVTLTKSFSIAKYLVTQADYLAVVGRNPSYFNTNNGFSLDLSRPVESVSWNDATNYCALRTQQERTAGLIPLNSVYRLPTEAELEFGCRAQTSTRFSYGDDLNYASLEAFAWYTNDSRLMTHAVGQRLPNPWGLYDMHGQVFEWCQDWYGPYPGGNVTDPQGPATGSSRVARGGSWLDTGQYCRSARRNGFSPDYSDSRFGFRVLLDPGRP